VRRPDGRDALAIARRGDLLRDLLPLLRDGEAAIRRLMKHCCN
jgi:hypothetical protein